MAMAPSHDAMKCHASFHQHSHPGVDWVDGELGALYSVASTCAWRAAYRLG